MELTPETFEKAEFVERRRGGYDIDQVETFLEETGTEFARMLVKFERREADLATANDRVAELEKQVSDLRQKLTLTTDRLIDTEQRLEAEVAARAAEADAAGAGGGAPQQSSEEDVTNVAKALLLAQEAADKALRDARAEAKAIVDGANARSERQFAETTTKIAALVNEAKARADREYAARKEAISEELTEMELRREELAENISRMEVRISGYRDDLRRAGEELISIADDPAFLGSDDEVDEARPAGVPAVAADAARTPEDSTGEPVAEVAAADEADVVEEPESDSAAVVDDAVDDGVEPTADVDEEDLDEASADAVVEEPATIVEEATGATAEDESGEDAVDEADAGDEADGVVEDTTDPAVVADERVETTRTPGTRGDRRGPQLAQGWFDADPPSTRDEPQDRSPEEPSEVPSAESDAANEDTLDLRSTTKSDETPGRAVDPDRGEWGPGSWSMIEKSLQERKESSGGDAEAARDADAIEVEASTSVTPAVGGATPGGSTDDDATEAIDRVELIRDRYLEELDQAVNTELDAEDEALAAFLEGTGDSKARRFGWRR